MRHQLKTLSEMTPDMQVAAELLESSRSVSDLADMFGFTFIIFPGGLPNITAFPTLLSVPVILTEKNDNFKVKCQNTIGGRPLIMETSNIEFQ
ncbi:hypothetical protein [Paenibacillus piri]|uniref:Uncharacterized protein n=1 Tax=Paenibacillus piri TaxID=2547395 RepID=A0A4R5KCL8_9BACL|nr:hypothetical protein [Paenibacillus piri]TDF92375.1 hypothetical protein E1757_30390 [Paenibacillus piri]